MRHLSLLTLTAASLALSACGMLSEDAPPPTKKAETTSPAAKGVSSSAQEEKEMTALMGKAQAPAESLEPDTAVATEGVTPSDAPPPMETATAAAAEDPSAKKPTTPPPANAPAECPGVEVLPDTKSITYFDDPEGKATGQMLARASLVDIKGGCDYTADGVVVDIDMIMQGRINDAGRYEGRKDLEAFMTFPYFVAVMDPSGKMIDKKIMATAMRFKPQIDDLDHAEKITQSIPMPDISQGPNYTITVGFQLNRAQLDYNRGAVSAKSAGQKASEKKVEEKSKPADAPKADVKAETKTESPAKASSETPTTPAPTPSAKKSSGAKMKPIAE